MVPLKLRWGAEFDLYKMETNLGFNVVFTNEEYYIAIHFIFASLTIGRFWKEVR